MANTDLAETDLEFVTFFAGGQSFSIDIGQVHVVPVQIVTN